MTLTVGQISEQKRLLSQAYDALKRREYARVAAGCRRVLALDPKCGDAHFLVGLAAAEMRDWGTALKAFQTVVGLEPQNLGAWAQLARSFAVMGQFENAETALAKAIEGEVKEAFTQNTVGTVYGLLGDQKAALDWHSRAASIAPAVAAFGLERARSLVFLGQFGEAEQELERIIALKPEYGEAHLLKSTLTKATDRSHAKQLEDICGGQDFSASRQLLQQGAYLYYGLGKLYEDLNDWEAAFTAFSAGATLKHKLVRYEEAQEEALFETLTQTYTASWLKAAGPGYEAESPIFIVGQPRTGTTLVERIITAHSDVTAAGELQQFVLALKRLSAQKLGRVLDARTLGAAADLDMRQLGELYIKSTLRMKGNSQYFIDKMPVNYLYIPLILAALPAAKIIHVRRGAMDTCFASFKHLFADAYPHSYDLQEMARHFVRYDKVMTHYRQQFPARFFEVHYEDLVENFTEIAHSMIDYLGIGWQEACLNFYEADGAVTTASARQVRSKLHRKSIGRWQCYDRHLMPMKTILEQAGLV